MNDITPEVLEEVINATAAGAIMILLSSPSKFEYVSGINDAIKAIRSGIKVIQEREVAVNADDLQ